MLMKLQDPLMVADPKGNNEDERLLYLICSIYRYFLKFLFSKTLSDTVFSTLTPRLVSRLCTVLPY